MKSEITKIIDVLKEDYFFSLYYDRRTPLCHSNLSVHFILFGKRVI